MARCEITGKSPVVKNLVSHSNIKTKSVAMPNVQKKRLYSSVLDQSVTLKVATTAIKSMEHSGGFDRYILTQPADNMSKRARAVRSRIHRKITKSKTQKEA
jgi:large subunit ribosomal protein L28